MCAPSSSASCCAKERRSSRTKGWPSFLPYFRSRVQTSGALQCVLTVQASKRVREAEVLVGKQEGEMKQLNAVIMEADKARCLQALHLSWD